MYISILIIYHAIRDKLCTVQIRAGMFYDMYNIFPEKSLTCPKNKVKV